MEKLKKVTSHHLFLPVFALALLLLFNAFATPGFFSIEIQNGQLFGGGVKRALHLGNKPCKAFFKAVKCVRTAAEKLRRVTQYRKHRAFNGIQNGTVCKLDSRRHCF